jgi:steroid delta-isomerase-like uncharacterized protein
MSGDPRDLVLRYGEEVWNQRRLEVIDEIFAADHIYRDPVLTDLPRGPEGVRQKVITYTTAFPDSHVDSEMVVTEDEWAALYWRYSGTHQGDMLGIPPTGRHASAEGRTSAASGAGGSWRAASSGTA